MQNILLLGSLVLGLFPFGAFSQEMPETLPVRDAAVQFALEESIMFPSVDGEFHENGLVTRLEYSLAALDRLYKNEDIESCYRNISPSQPVTYERLFSDVERETWYGKNLCVGMHVGILQGKGDGSFQPFASITVAEAAKMLAKAYGLVHGSDVGEAWYADAMQALAARGAIRSEMNPHHLLTRREMAQMFYALRSEPRLVMTPMAAPSWDDVEDPVTAPAPVFPQPSEGQDTLASDDCSAYIGPGSPGAALLILGHEAHPRRLDRSSHRVLRAQVEESYQNGTPQPRTQPVRETSIFSRCGDLAARSPGAALLVQGRMGRPANVQRVPNRVLQQQAMDRDHTGGVIVQ